MADELKLREELLRWREIDGELIAVDIPSSAYLSANPAATILWALLVEGTTRDALAERLVEAFGIDLERARADVDVFVAGLAARGLLDA
jgi:hypothetical protein